jgi:predicted O-methyltransferase YrrM
VNVLNFVKSAMTPRQQQAVGMIAHPFQHRRKILELRRRFPQSHKWLALSHRVQGWLEDLEGDWLYQLARGTADIDPVVVELGSFKGRSSVVLAAGLLGKANARLFCVDTFAQDEDPDYQRRFYEALLRGERHDLFATFLRNVRSCGVVTVITPLRGFTFEHASNWRLPIDLLFIDANHEFPAVMRDFQQWSPFVKRGGVIAFHDVSDHFEGPRRVVAEGVVPPAYSSVQQAYSLAWATKLQ